MIIDTHSHLQFDAFKDDRDEVVQRTLVENMSVINVGTGYQTSKDAVLLAEKYGHGFYAAVGLHPMYAAAEFMKLKKDDSEGELSPEVFFDKEKYRALAKSKKVVAIGEIGLDYYYKPKTAAKLQQFKEKQKQVFLQQLDLAKELNLPVILHCRMAHEGVIKALQHSSIHTGVVHCFTGTLEQAKKYIELGFYLGINGIIFKFNPIKSAEGGVPSGQFNGVNIDEVIKNVSLENMLLETDCPYLTPPMAESKRNEPIFIKHTIQKIAQLKSVTFEEVAQKTTKNAKKLFSLL